VIRKELEQIFCQFDSKLEAADEVRLLLCPQRVAVAVRSPEAVAAQHEPGCAPACGVGVTRISPSLARSCDGSLGVGAGAGLSVLVPVCPCLSWGVTRAVATAGICSAGWVARGSQWV